MTRQAALADLGQTVFNAMPKISAEFFAITYGSLVRQILATCDDNIEAVNHQLDEIGFRIGVRMIEEYVARVVLSGGDSSSNACRSFQQSGEAIAKVGLKMFLGITASVGNVVTNKDSFTGGTKGVAGGEGRGASGNTGQVVESYSLLFADNPLNLFVELPSEMRNTLWYSNILCGVIRGALEQTGMLTKVEYVRDVLHGSATNEIKVSLIGISSETFKTN